MEDEARIIELEDRVNRLECAIRGVKRELASLQFRGYENTGWPALQRHLDSMLRSLRVIDEAPDPEDGAVPQVGM